jgi:hypothetical protein
MCGGNSVHISDDRRTSDLVETQNWRAPFSQIQKSTLLKYPGQVGDGTSRFCPGRAMAPSHLSNKKWLLQHDLLILVGTRKDLFRLVTKRDKFYIADDFDSGIELHLAFDG